MTRRLCVIFAVACVCAVPTSARAQDDAFKQGLEARGDRKWADVVRHMQAAVKANGQESTRKVRTGFLGTSWEYLPHYFLGEGLFNQGDCGGAISEWQISEQHGALKSRADLVAAMRKMLQSCAAKGVLIGADYAPIYASTLQAYTDATALAKRVSDLGSAHKDLWRADSDEQYGRAKKELEASLARLTAGQRTRVATHFTESKAASDRAVNILRPLENSLNAAVDNLSTLQRQIKEAEQAIAGADDVNNAIEALKTSLTAPMQSARKSSREQLTQARERLTVGQKTQNVAAVGDALKYAQTASTTLTQILEQARKMARGVFEQQFGEALRAADEAFARISAAITTLDRRAAQRPELVPQETTNTRATLEKQVDALRRRLERARKAEDLASLTETTRLAGEAQLGLDTLIKSFGPLSLRDRGIHAALEEGARLYLDGDYQKALAALEPLVGQPDIPLRQHAHVFRAASLYALYMRSGESNAQLRSQALAEIAQSKQLDSSFQPSPRAFSPRFLSLYHTDGAPPQPAGGATPQ
jgi:hypothetical protein